MGRPNPSRKNKFSDANGDRKIFIFLVQLTSSRIDNLTRSVHTLLYVMAIYAYIHTYIHIYNSDYFLNVSSASYLWYKYYVTKPVVIQREIKSAPSRTMPHLSFPAEQHETS